MAIARFQVVSLAGKVRSSRAAASSGAPRRTPNGVLITSPGPRRFTWRFLAANNRSLASAFIHYPDAASCVAAIREVSAGVPTADPEFSRDETGAWRWLVRTGATVATSSHSYSRRARADTTCRTFCALAGDPGVADRVQVLYL